MVGVLLFRGYELTPDMQIFYALFIVGLLCGVVGRLIDSRAKRLLSTEQKAIVAEMGRQRVRWFYGILFFLVILAFVTRRTGWMTTGFLVSMFLFAVIFGVIDFRRFSHSEFPPAYLRSVRIDVLLSAFAMILIIAAAAVYTDLIYVRH